MAAAKVRVTGNTVVDALEQNRDSAMRSDVEAFTEGSKDYMLATVHRAENVDDHERLSLILRGLEVVGDKWEVPVVYPVHPRAAGALGELRSRRGFRWVRFTEPADYLQFLKLEAKASLVLTDSGGVQEEACVLKVPCVTLRDNTERPETIEVGANVLAGADPDRIARGASKMLKRRRNWKNPFGDGRAAEKIVKAWTDSS
ncbi:MAG TPA: UDP-N-acetylglucosamine 2-epimerase [Nitrososphaerales archaeon]|nr:UDP-N-acetylglucosamine 2-epimerase [Nitrososphaerales archaeon]